MRDEKNKKLKALCLSFRTPPAVRPQAILIGKMIPEWIRQGIEPAVITYKDDAEWEIDIPIYRIPAFRYNRYLDRLPPLRELRKYFYYKKMAPVVAGIARKEKADLIFSFSNPIESNIIGAMAAKITGLKFVSHFSDPWHDNPLEHVSWLAKIFSLAWEKFIMRGSDKVIFCNRQLKNMVMKKFPEAWSGKTAIIPHCYDLTDYPEVKKEGQDGKFIISYIGVFYKDRNPEILFQALKNVFSKNPKIKERITLKLVGSSGGYTGFPESRVKEMLSGYGLLEITELVPSVPYEESLRLMKLSDLLIVIDANFKDSPFLPSKVIDYAGSQTPILGITPAGSPTDEFLKNIGYKSFNYEEADKAGEYIEKMAEESKMEVKFKKEFFDQYDVKNTTKKLVGIFNSL